MEPPEQPLAVPGSVRAAGQVPLAGFYLLYFSTIGILLPFLPQWFWSLELSGTQIGALLAFQPAMTLVVPSLWGWVVDRFGRPDRVLNVVSLGVVSGFSLVAMVDEFLPLAAAMAVYAFFASSMTTVLDSIALQRVALHGGSYARIRLFGSLGFVISSTLFGLWVTQIDRRAVLVPLGCMVAYLLWSFTLRARSLALPPRHLLAGVRLLKHRDLALMLAASALHWIACAPFHGTFSIHATSLGLQPWVVGVSAGVGVMAEIAVMWLYPRFGQRFAPRHILFVAFAASALRWLGMAITVDPRVMVALSLLHGLTFGAFYVAAVAFVAIRVPAAMRASGQALLASVTFGVGGLVGYLVAGAGYQWLGGQPLFGLAAVAELAPAVLVLFIRDARATAIT